MNKALNFNDTPNYTAIKEKQKAIWASGNYALIGTTLQITGENLAEAMDIHVDQNVLDVAAGNGNFTLAAARRWARVTSSDYVDTLLENNRQRANANGFTPAYQLADAESLPFDDGAFDAVASTFGVMFCPNQAQAAMELIRVCRPGGKIGMANWTPQGFIGEIFKTIGRYVPPPPGLDSPALWGTEAHLSNLFGEHASEMEIQCRDFVFRYRSAAHWLEVFRRYYGPIHKAFASLDEAQQEALTHDLITMIERRNTATDGTMRVPGEYLEAVITRGSTTP